MFKRHKMIVFGLLTLATLLVELLFQGVRVKKLLSRGV